MEAIKGCGYWLAVEADVRGASRIPRIAEASIRGHYKRGKPDFGHHGHRCRQEFIVSVASPQLEVRHHRGHCAIEIIGEEFA